MLLSLSSPSSKSDSGVVDRERAFRVLCFLLFFLLDFFFFAFFSFDRDRNGDPLDDGERDGLAFERLRRFFFFIADGDLDLRCRFTSSTDLDRLLDRPSIFDDSLRRRGCCKLLSPLYSLASAYNREINTFTPSPCVTHLEHCDASYRFGDRIVLIRDY